MRFVCFSILAIQTDGSAGEVPDVLADTGMSFSGRKRE